jgi:hypothetical protein
MGQKETAITNKNRIMIYGPKSDGTYVIDLGRPQGGRGSIRQELAAGISTGASASATIIRAVYRTGVQAHHQDQSWRVRVPVFDPIGSIWSPSR